MRNIIWLIVLRLAARASGQQAQEVYIVPQPNAPVQIVSITPYGNNLLARVVVKNNTDRYVQDFGITWTIFRPANCTASGRPAPRIAGVSRASVQRYAEDRRWWMLAGQGGSRVLLPHEQTQTNWWLWLTRKELAKFSKDYDARKLRVQIGIEHVNYGNRFTNRSGPPDWVNEALPWAGVGTGTRVRFQKSGNTITNEAKRFTGSPPRTVSQLRHLERNKRLTLVVDEIVPDSMVASPRSQVSVILT